MTMTITSEAVEPVGFCWECGYSLRGLASRRCPECGRPFDPADETTMNMGQEVGWVARWLMRPPGWPMYALLAGAVLVSLWACVVPTRRGAFSDVLSELLLMSPGLWWRRHVVRWGNYNAPVGRFLLGAALWTLLIGAWIVRRVARGLMVRRVSRQKPAAFAYWRRWLVVPVVLGATVMVCMTRLPIYPGFWISRPWLERAVREAQARGRPAPPRTIGLYADCKVVDPAGGQATVDIWNDVFLLRREGRQPPLPGYRVTQLSTNWFMVEPDRISN
jgi:hypothetical protein